MLWNDKAYTALVARSDDEANIQRRCPQTLSFARD
jgi:hypothetical protein